MKLDYERIITLDEVKRAMQINYFEDDSLLKEIEEKYSQK